MPACLPLGLSALGALLAALVLAPASALACSRVAVCAPPVRLFPNGAPVPGNLVYFKLTAAEPGVLTLRTSAGRAVPASIRTIGLDRVFAPDADVPADQQLELEYTTVCPLPGPQPTQETFGFTTTAAQPLEIPSPSLMLEDVGETRDHPNAPNHSVAYVTLGFTAVCKSCSAAHLTDTQFGGDDGWGHVQQDRIDLLTTCEGLQISNSCSGDVLAPPGRYRVEAWSTVVGAPQQPRHAVREVELRCHADGCALAGSSRAASDGGAALVWVALALVSRRRGVPARG